MASKKTHFFFLIPTLSLLLSVFSGCATSRLPLDIYQGQIITIGGEKYLPLIDICKKENIDWDYDDISRAVTLTKENTVIKLMVDSPVALVEGKAEDLKQPVRLSQGIIVVPYSFKSAVLPRISKIKPPQELVIIPRYKINKVCIDAGHGGKDPGAVGRKYGLKEKSVVLDIAMRLKRELKAKGLEVITTRASDVFIPLERRAEIANSGGADLFISVHANASKRRSTTGFEAYYIADSADDLARALVLAENGVVLPQVNNAAQSGLPKNVKAILWDLTLTENRFESVELARNICKFSAQDAGLKILGIKGASFAVLKHTKIPAVLVEVGFISNSEEEKYMKNAFYRQQISEALACGILSYIKNAERKNNG